MRRILVPVLADVKEYYRCCMRILGCNLKLLTHFRKPMVSICERF